MTKQKNTKFIVMGLVALATVYSIQGAAVPLYNEYVNSIHDIKMVNLYNKIWPEVDKKDLSKEIKEYKILASNRPDNYQFGVYPVKKEKFIYAIPKYLPSAQNLEEDAKKLNKKIKLF